MNNIIELIIENKKKYFGEFFRSFLEVAVEKFDNKILPCINELNKEKYEVIKSSFMEETFIELFGISIKTLIVEIHLLSTSNRLSGKDKYERYDNFIELLKSDEYKKELKNKYPILFSLLDSRVKYKVQLWYECLERLLKDKNEILQEFNIDIKDFDKIETSSGDTHCYGRHVMIITFENNKLVYKPHSMKSDKVYEYIIDNLNKKMKYKLNTLKCINKDEYGWQEYAAKNSDDNNRDLDTFYYKAGMLLAVCNSILCTDLHNENIMNTKDQLMIVDLETLTHNNTEKLGIENLTAIDNLFTDYNDSVMSTMLLPTKSTFSPIDFDIGGMSSSVGQSSKKFYSFGIQNEGTDEVMLAKKISQISEMSNIVYDGNNVVNIRKYRNKIIEGFKETYKTIYENRDELIDLLRKETAPIRQVLRPTAVYCRVNEAINYPDYFENEEKRSAFLSKMKNGLSKESLRYKIAEEEIKEMKRGDIPYVYTKFNSRSVWINGREIENFYEKSIFEIIQKHLLKMNDENCEKQCYYINLSLSTLKVDNEEESLYHKFKLKDGESNKYLSLAEEIAEKIIKYSHWSDDKKQCAWLTNTSINDEVYLDISNSLIYNFGGLPIFLVTLWKETGKKEYLDLAKAQIEILMKGQSLENYSLFAGCASNIYLYYEMYKATNNIEYKNELLKIYENIKKEKIDISTQDIISGLSGTIVLSVNIYKEMKEEIILEKICEMCEKLYNDMINNNYENMTGFAHGLSGYALALVYGGAVTGKNNYIDMAHELIKKENSYYSPEENGWRDLREKNKFVSFNYWCHGSIGILISRIKILNSINGYDALHNEEFINVLKDDIKAIGDSMKSENFYDNERNYGLCHGYMGQVDGLIELNKYMRNSYDNELEKAKDKIINDMYKLGISTGDKQIIEDYSFMNGLAGIGYELLRISNIDYPSVLSLEV